MSSWRFDLYSCPSSGSSSFQIGVMTDPSGRSSNGSFPSRKWTSMMFCRAKLDVQRRQIIQR